MKCKILVRMMFAFRIQLLFEGNWHKQIQMAESNLKCIYASQTVVLAIDLRSLIASGNAPLEVILVLCPLKICVN